MATVESADRLMTEHEGVTASILRSEVADALLLTEHHHSLQLLITAAEKLRLESDGPFLLHFHVQRIREHLRDWSRRTKMDLEKSFQ